MKRTTDGGLIKHTRKKNGYGNTQNYLWRYFLSIKTLYRIAEMNMHRSVRTMMQ
ncbi:MAG: hypothetical protein HYZ34_00225 [Ignavibacteriae bacterium]|nr:hypothetical protein [Ignavibacteriota bacterium]